MPWQKEGSKRIDPQEHVRCPHCNSLFSTTILKGPMREFGMGTCEVCNGHMHWNSTWEPVDFQLIEKGAGK